jgi:CRISPR system Cascade subunit CasB
MYQKQDREKLMTWWQRLDDNRADRAILRRTTCVDDVLLTSAFAHFLKVMPPGWSDANHLFGSAMVAGLLARIKVNSSDSLAKALALRRKTKSTDLRFRQLQKSRNEDEFFLRMTRAIALIDGQVDVISVADSALLWLKEQREMPDKNPQRRLAVRWAFDYYTNLNS